MSEGSAVISGLDQVLIMSIRRLAFLKRRELKDVSGWPK